MRLTTEPSSPCNDLGTDAIDLWQLRYEAERDMIAALTPDPAKLMPVVAKLGINLSCFEADPHRILYVLMEQHGHKGPLRVLDLSVQYWRWQRWNKTAGFRDILINTFDRFPVSIVHAEFQAARLRHLVGVCRDAERFLAFARRAVEDGLSRHAAGFTTKQHRGTGGNTGATKKAVTTTLTRPSGSNRLSA